MKKNYKYGIILPLKEIYTLKKSGAASIYVNEYLKQSSLSNSTIVFTTKSKGKPLSKNIFHVNNNSRFFTNFNYLMKICKSNEFKNLENIEVHNRPSYAEYLIKKYPSKNITLVLHNITYEKNTQLDINKKKFLIKNCKSIIFVSNFLRNKFFSNLKMQPSNNSHVIYNIIFKAKKFNNNKNKLIIFAGKLNKSKGYNVFGESIINILNKFNDWSAVVIGNEKREIYNFKHKNLTIKNWMSHSDLIKYYNKASISVVNPNWNEPFGRTALESSSRGCAVITTKSGGLSETFKNNLILKKNNKEELVKKITNLIKNPKQLKFIQKKNFYEQTINPYKEVFKYDSLKIKTKIYDKNKNKKLNIIHIGVFGAKLSYRAYNLSIASKISNGLIKNGHHVINYDYRSKIDSNNEFNLTNFIKSKNIDDNIIDISNNYKPDLIILGHNNILSRETILNIKKKYNTKFSLWYEDHITKGDPNALNNLKLIEQNNDLIDQYFITTHPKHIKSKIKKTKINFLPMPVDASIEKYNLYNQKIKFKDLFFAISHGINRGSLKNNHQDIRQKFINNLINYNKNILKFNFLGFNEEQPKWNHDLYDEMQKCYFALNLSRGGPYKYTSSNRIATYVGNGMPTCVDKRLKFSDFFNDNEMIFYNNEKDLINKLLKLLKKPKKIYRIGVNGKKKYFKLFNNLIISDYILSKTFNYKSKYKFIWLQK